jgi:hypothetical protein
MSPNSEKRVRQSSSVQSLGICPTNILIESGSGSLKDPFTVTPFKGERLEDADDTDSCFDVGEGDEGTEGTPLLISIMMSSIESPEESLLKSSIGT